MQWGYWKTFSFFKRPKEIPAASVQNFLVIKIIEKL